MAVDDPEIEAMRKIADAVSGMDAPSVQRVLKWAVGRFGGASAPALSSNGETGAEQTDVAALYSTAAPTTDPERALVVGYWFQVHMGMRDFDAQRVNAALKDMGHRVSNITDAFSRLMNRRPQWVVQTRKTGAQRQGRKLYRLTDEGIRRVRAMLGGNREEEAD